MATKSRYVYSFGGGTAEGKGEQKALLGGKGANLAEMARLGLPVPPGFTITTEVCTWFYDHGKSYPKGLDREVASHLGRIEKQLGRGFGDPARPLLVSVRSGARASMPGMMDTILNLGLNDRTVEGLAAGSKNPRFAWDCYRRFVAMYGDVVLDLKPVDKRERDPFEVILEKKKHARGVKLDTELPVDALKELVREFKAEIRKRTGHSFPDDPVEHAGGTGYFRPSLYSKLSTSASQLAWMMLSLAPTVPHVSWPSVLVMWTRVPAAVPSCPLMMRTL